MKKIFYLIMIVAQLASCKSDDDGLSSQRLTEVELQGEWREIANSEEGLFEGKSRVLAFECNTFYLTVSSYTDGASPHDSCSKFNWKEYARGEYTLSDNQLTLDGFYTDSLFNKKSSGCYNIGEFNKTYSTDYQGINLKLQPVNQAQSNEMEFYKKENHSCVGF